jgi:glycosyltransferase involved in cell wall biosynthesis
MKKQFLIVIPTLGVGGAETTLLNLLDILDYDKIDVTLVVVLRRGKFIDKIPCHLNVIFLIKSDLIDKIIRYLYLKFNNLFLIKLFAKKIKGKYDLGLCYLDSFATEYLIHSNAEIMRKATLIQSSYMSWKLVSDAIKKQGRSKLEKRYSNMDYVLAVSEDSLNEFKQIYGEMNSLRLFKNPMNSEKIKMWAIEKPEIEFDNSIMNIVALGRLIEVKGYDLLIEAASLLKAKESRFRIYIIGMGSLQYELINLIKKYKLEQHVTLTGFVNNPYALIAHSDLFVMTSRSEGLPTSLCEAMILGKPVLVTNVPGCREVVNHGEFGMCVNLNEIDISKGLYDFIVNKEQREYFSKKSIERSKLYDDNVILHEFYKLIDGII